MKRATTKPPTQTMADRISGAVQLGAVELWIGPRDENGACEYTVAAPVMPYYGMRPRQGLAPWVLQHGRTRDDDATLEERCKCLYRDGALVYVGNCARHDWPYEY